MRQLDSDRPYVKAWNRDYAPLGLVVIGVHAPEFEFGKRAENIDRESVTRQVDVSDRHRQRLSHLARVRERRVAGEIPLRRSRPTRASMGRQRGAKTKSSARIRRLLAAAQPGITLPVVSDESSMFAKTGQPSYVGITNETYIGADRGEPGVVALNGDWHTDRHYVELKRGNGEIVLPFTAGEVNLVMQPGPSGRAAVLSAARWKASRRRRVEWT